MAVVSESAQAGRLHQERRYKLEIVMNSDRQRDTVTHFGYQNVSEAEKDSLVGNVFHSVSDRYDLMNDLMSFGAHRVWKKLAIAYSGIRHNSQVLDVAGGTGDMSLAIARKLGPKGRIVLTDINDSMLKIGQDRMIDKGYLNRLQCVQTDAENLAFADDSFDCVIISFGLRNVTRIDQALKSMFRVSRCGGRLIILEFSKPFIPVLEKLYDRYSFNVIPRLGQWVTGDRESYQYLVESIRKHPDQEVLADMMADSGYERVEYHNITGGIVAIHVGWKI